MSFHGNLGSSYGMLDGPDTAILRTQPLFGNVMIQAHHEWILGDINNLGKFPRLLSRDCHRCEKSRFRSCRGPSPRLHPRVLITVSLRHFGQAVRVFYVDSRRPSRGTGFKRLAYDSMAPKYPWRKSPRWNRVAVVAKELNLPKPCLKRVINICHLTKSPDSRDARIMDKRIFRHEANSAWIR